MPKVESRIDTFIVAFDDKAEIFGFELMTNLRRKGLTVTMDFAKRSMKVQMKQAGKSNAKFALIIGEDEVKNNIVTVKDLSNSEQ